MIYCVGICLRTVIATHIQFRIGAIQTDPKRRLVLTYMTLCMNQYVHHPIGTEEFKRVVKIAKIVHENDALSQPQQQLNQQNNIKVFQRIYDYNDWKLLWDETKIHQFILNEAEIYVKGGGIGNFKKSKFSIFESRYTYQVYVG